MLYLYLAATLVIFILSCDRGYNERTVLFNIVFWPLYPLAFAFILSVIAIVLMICAIKEIPTLIKDIKFLRTFKE